MIQYCRDRVICPKNEERCNNCKIKIVEELSYKILKNESNIFFKNNKVIKEYENSSGAKYKIIMYKGIEFCYYECQQCFIWYRIFDHPFRLSYSIESNKTLKPTCSIKCMTRHRSKEPYANNGIRFKFCEKCNKETKHNSSICCECYPFSLTEGFIIKECSNGNVHDPCLHSGNRCFICNPWDNLAGFAIKFCNICNKETYHNGTICCTCDESAMGERPGGEGFIVKKCSNGKNHKECVHVGNRCFICDPWDLNIKIVKLENNELYCLDGDSKKFIKIEDYFNKFLLFHLRNQSIDDIQKIYGGFYIPTFRTSENSWNGDKKIFNEYLKTKNIGYNVYIKFYKNNKNEIFPLVCGKSGSYLVNNSGHDLIFSTNIEHGIARIFLDKMNFKWNYSQIFIIPVETEKIALQIESEIQKRFKILGS